MFVGWLSTEWHLFINQRGGGWFCDEFLVSHLFCCKLLTLRVLGIFFLTVLGGFLWAYEQRELQQKTVCAFVDILLKSFTVLEAIKEVGRPRKSFRKVIISSVRFDKLCGLIALRCSFYKELINWTFIWYPFCVWTPVSDFCRFPLQCLSKGLQKFRQTDLCKVQMGRTGLLWCCWCSEEGPWLMGRAALQRAGFQVEFAGTHAGRKSLSVLHVWCCECKTALMLLPPCRLQSF